MVKRWLLFLLLLLTIRCGLPTASMSLYGELTIAQMRNDLPTDWHITGNENGYLLEPMRKYAESIKITLIQQDSLIEVAGGKKGTGGYNRKARTLWLDTSQTQNMQVTTFAHELGHAFSPEKLKHGTPEAEVFAEAVGCLVLDHFGFNIRKPSFAYLTYTQHEGLFALQLYSNIIDSAVKEIVAGIKRFQ